MVNKILVYSGVGVFVFILGISILLSAGVLNSNDIKSIQSQTIVDTELAKYRSEDIPEDCRLPNYDDDIEAWKEHLSHHQNTLYCLDYYK